MPDAPKLTPWFDVACMPCTAGVYLRDTGLWSKFDGRLWMRGCVNAIEAGLQTKPSRLHTLCGRWRGLCRPADPWLVEVLASPDAVPDFWTHLVRRLPPPIRPAHPHPDQWLEEHRASLEALVDSRVAERIEALRLDMLRSKRRGGEWAA